jgi:hypothetical protein
MKPILTLVLCLALSGCTTKIQSGGDTFSSPGNIAAKRLQVGNVVADDLKIDVSGPIQAVGRVFDDLLMKMGILGAVGGGL